jgi:hypothetical protein
MLGLWILLTLNGLTTEQILSADCAASLCWDVSPQICVTAQQNQYCHAQLQLVWVSKAPLDTCLYMAEQKLHCWQDVSRGYWQQDLGWQNTELTLRDNDNLVLLRTELQIQSRKPARRRLNSPWSIF